MAGRIIRSAQSLLLLACGVAVSEVGAVPMYSVTDLGDLPGGRSISGATGINNLGQVVGLSDIGPRRHAFLWDATTGMRDLGSLLDNASVGLDVNDRGLVVGNSGETVGRNQGFVWDPVNGMRDLAALIDPSLGWIIRDANAVNNSGQVVGFADTGEGSMAFVWDAVHGARVLDGLPVDLIFSRALDINELGQIVGRIDFTVSQHAFLWDPITGLQDLGDLPGDGDVSSANGINDASQVVGTGETANGGRAFLWENGVMIELGDLPMGAVGSAATDINNAGQVVGNLFIASWDHAFLWDATNGMRDLNELIDPLLGWSIIEAQAINDAGQIAVTGFQPASCQIVPLCQHALLLTPIAVPEPGGLVMLGLGVAALAMFRRRLHPSEVIRASACAELRRIRHQHVRRGDLAGASRFPLSRKFPGEGVLDLTASKALSTSTRVTGAKVAG